MNSLFAFTKRSNDDLLEITFRILGLYLAYVETAPGVAICVYPVNLIDLGFQITICGRSCRIAIGILRKETSDPSI